jgi:hypothetical protein
MKVYWYDELTHTVVYRFAWRYMSLELSLAA